MLQCEILPLPLSPVESACIDNFKEMKLPQFSILILGVWATSACDAGQQLDAVADVRTAPNFAIEDIEGKVHELSGYEGQVLVVNFWATWPPLRQGDALAATGLGTVA